MPTCAIGLPRNLRQHSKPWRRGNWRLSSPRLMACGQRLSPQSAADTPCRLPIVFRHRNSRRRPPPLSMSHVTRPSGVGCSDTSVDVTGARNTVGKLKQALRETLTMARSLENQAWTLETATEFLRSETRNRYSEGCRAHNCGPRNG